MLTPPCTAPPCEQVKPAIYVTYNGDFFDWPFMGALRWSGAGRWGGGGEGASSGWRLRGMRAVLRRRGGGACSCLPGQGARPGQHAGAAADARPGAHALPRPPAGATLAPAAETRAGKHGMDMGREIGFVCNRKSNETLSRWA